MPYGSRNLQMDNDNVALEAPLGLGSVRRFEEPLQCLRQIASRFFDGVALTCDVQFGRQRATNPLPSRSTTAINY